jgi:hypothetical protein
VALLTFFPSVRSIAICLSVKTVLEDRTFVTVALFPDIRRKTFAPFQLLGNVTALFFTLVIVASIICLIIASPRRTANEIGIVCSYDGQYAGFVVESAGYAPCFGLELRVSAARRRESRFLRVSKKLFSNEKKRGIIAE